MARYYAHITGAANISTVFNPFISYTGNGNYLRIEYAGNITTNATSNVYVWRQTSGGWFSLEQGSFEQYLNLGSTTYVPDVINTAANRRKFNSDNPNNPAVFDLNNGTANLTFNNWTTTGTYTSNFSNNGIVFFPSRYAASLIMDFYEFKVYGANDTLLFDYVPDYDGAAMGLRDKVSGSLYAATDQSKIQLFSLTTFEIQPEEEYVLYTSGTTTIALSADEGLTWTASTTDNWISLSTSTGTGTGNITLSYAENPTFQSRTGTVTFTSNGGDVLTFTIEQEQKPVLVYDRPIYRSGNLVKKMYRSGELIYYKLNYSPDPDYKSMPLTFKVNSGGTISWRANSSAYTKEIQYSINDGAWVSITSTTAGVPISLNTGDIVRFKGDGAISTSSSYINRFRDSTIVFEVYGNIMSLIDSTGYATATTAADHSFRNLFEIQTGLTSVENLVLPATTIGTNVYKRMFSGCTSLITAPSVLPATVLTESCYSEMFRGCTSLTSTPSLPATTLALSCYSSMFQGCTSLTSAPELPATTLALSCYSSMFSRCTSLTTAPELPATTLTSYCYQNMFRACTSLNYIKCLATDITADSCTSNWVNGVSSTGTFVTPSSTEWTTGVSGIPTNWTRVDA